MRLFRRPHTFQTSFKASGIDGERDSDIKAESGERLEARDGAAQMKKSNRIFSPSVYCVEAYSAGKAKTPHGGHFKQTRSSHTVWNGQIYSTPACVQLRSQDHMRKFNLVKLIVCEGLPSEGFR